MPLGDTAQTTASAYEKVIAGVLNEMVDEVWVAVPQLTKSEVVTMLDQFDIDNFVLKELGLQAEIDAVMTQYSGVLLETPFFSSIDESVIQSLINLERQTIIAKASTISQVARSEIAKGVLLGKARDQMKKDLIEVSGLRPYQAGVELNNQMNNFSSQVMRIQAENADPEQTYIYVGPADNRTRGLCLNMLSEGEMTLRRIDDVYGDAFVERGGYNCRHFWRPYSEELSRIKKKQEKSLEELSGNTRNS